MTTSRQTYTRSHMAVYVSDNMRNLVKTLLHHCGFNWLSAVDAMSDMEVNAVRTCLESGHLYCIVVQFYYPGDDNALALWEFSIRYDGNGAAGMWVDSRFFRDSLAKAKALPDGCLYCTVLRTYPNCPDVPGAAPATLLSINGLVTRESGTVIVTPGIWVSARCHC